MNQTQLHIITVGTSILNKYSSEILNKKYYELNDSFWEKYLEDENLIKDILIFLQKNPRGYSAEINSFMAFKEKENIENDKIKVFFVSTKTNAGELSKIILEKYFKTMLQIEIWGSREIHGYYNDLELFNKDKAIEEYKKDIINLLELLLRLIQKAKKENYRVYLNATGGMKPHVITVAIAGMLTGSEVYYMHEGFNKQDILILPSIYYFFNKDEKDILNFIDDNNIVPINDLKKLFSYLPEDIIDYYLDNFLNRYIIKIDENDNITITEIGKFILNL
ncbi:MAG: hypothetical protein KatS3mg129_2470 [Leptospiraceae bacterium]|nr:MAG: hypothetical protein KatS3mg129_2470 [Leptospiraceae bacterium]